MDGKEKDLYNGEKSYFKEGEPLEHTIKRFLQDTFEGRSEEEINDSMDMIKEETADIEMGSTTKKALNLCSEFLAKKGIETGDESQAVDICTLRVLKMIPGIFDLQVAQENREDLYAIVLSNLIQRYILPEEEDILRTQVTGSNGMNSLDQHMRINGAAMNIQRHVSDEEIRKVLVYVRYLVKGYMNIQDF